MIPNLKGCTLSSQWESIYHFITIYLIFTSYRKTIATFSSLFLFGQNASRFYAEIDGAKVQLQNKQANYSRFDEDLVEKAMKYAQGLQDLADKLER